MNSLLDLAKVGRNGWQRHPENTNVLDLPWCWLIWWLASGAEVATTIADGDALNRGAADGAGLTAQAVSDLKLKVGSAQCSIRAEVGICAGSFIANG